MEVLLASDNLNYRDGRAGLSLILPSYKRFDTCERSYNYIESSDRPGDRTIAVWQK
jgi:hypothetical protein